MQPQYHRFKMLEARGGSPTRFIVFDLEGKRVVKNKLEKDEAIEMRDRLNGKVKVQAPVVVVHHAAPHVPVFARVKAWFGRLGHYLWVRFPMIRKLAGK